MARILAFDYGLKRTGLAVTDPLQIITSTLDTVDTPTVISYVQKYLTTETVELFLLGIPIREDGKTSHSTPHILKFKEELEKTFPSITVLLRDESYTSQQAMQVLIKNGTKKSKRREKGSLDKVSAAIILQEYLEEKSL